MRLAPWLLVVATTLSLLTGWWPAGPVLAHGRHGTRSTTTGTSCVVGAPFGRGEDAITLSIFLRRQVEAVDPRIGQQVRSYCPSVPEAGEVLLAVAFGDPFKNAPLVIELRPVEGADVGAPVMREGPRVFGPERALLQAAVEKGRYVLSVIPEQPEYNIGLHQESFLLKVAEAPGLGQRVDRVLKPVALAVVVVGVAFLAGRAWLGYWRKQQQCEL